MAVQLKNTGDEVSLWAPPGEDDAQHVAHDQVIAIPGVLAADPTADELAAGAAPLPDDAHVVVLPSGDHRAFPKSRWQLVTPSPLSSSRRDTGGKE